MPSPKLGIIVLSLCASIMGYLALARKIPINYYWPFRFFFITLQVVIAHIIKNR